MTRPGHFCAFFSLKQLIAGLSLLFCTHLAWSANWQDPNYIERAFIEVALKNEYQATKMQVAKWQSPIHYQFIYHGVKNNPLLEQITQIHLEHLQDITHLSIQPATKPANLKIIFTKDAFYKADILHYGNGDTRMGKLSTESNCMSSFHLNKQHVISRAVVIIPVDYAFEKGLFATCVVEETTQLLGLPNDSNWVNPSIANDASKIELLTGLDYIMLKILYDKNLKAGMTLNQLLPIIRRKIQSLKKTHIIQNAAKLVNQKGLYPYLN